MGTCGSVNDNKNHKTDTYPSTNGTTNPSFINSTGKSITTQQDKLSPYTKYEDVNKYYTLGAHKGSGSYGIVREATEKSTDKKFAVKTVWKAQFADKKKFIMQEIEILLKIEHENIIKCYQVYEDHNSIHFVFDLVEGGDLFDYLISSPNHTIPDSRAAEFFYQIIDAIQHLHHNKIVHRDIKPENFLVSHSDNKIKLVLIDFGFATFIKDGEKLNDKVGSLQYIAPEMLKDDDYDMQVDMWAAGVVLYNMITGKQPFFGKNDTELVNAILNSEVLYSDTQFKNMNAKQLCSRLLAKNPIDRANANDAKASMWIDNYVNLDLNPTSVDVKFQPKQENIQNILNLLEQKSNIKADVWSLFLTYLDIETMNNVKAKLLEMCSKEEAIKAERSLGGNEIVSYEVFLKTIIAQPGVSIDLIVKLNELLINKQEICEKQLFNFKVFLEKAVKCKQVIMKERVWNIFVTQDKKGVGYLNYDQMCQAFKENLSQWDTEKMKEILKMSTVDNKNNIKYEEFYKMWEKFNTSPKM